MNKDRSPVLGFFLVLGCSLALVTSGYVQAYTTNSGAWSDASTWGVTPSDGSTAYVAGGNTVSFGTGDSYMGGNAVSNALIVGGNGPNLSTGILNMSGDTLTTGNFLVGHHFAGTTNLSGGTGTFNVNGGSFTAHNLSFTAAGLLGMLLWPDRHR